MKLLVYDWKRIPKKGLLAGFGAGALLYFLRTAVFLQRYLSDAQAQERNVYVHAPFFVMAFMVAWLNEKLYFEREGGERRRLLEKFAMLPVEKRSFYASKLFLSSAVLVFFYAVMMAGGGAAMLCFQGSFSGIWDGKAVFGPIPPVFLACMQTAVFAVTFLQGLRK